MNATVRDGVPALRSLTPVTLDDALKLAQMLARSTMVPRDFQTKPENVLVAVLWGREVGLGPLQALQNIAVINGRPAVWGDAALALVRGSDACEYVREIVTGDGENMIATCRAKRRDDKEEIIATFSVPDAKKAGLWGKTGPWQQYPKRMLQMRARGFALRDAFPDVLKGVITAEEARDIPLPAFSGVTIDVAHEEPTPETAPGLADPATQHKQTAREWLSDMAATFDNAPDAEAVEALAASADVQRALGAFKNGALAQLQKMIDTARAVFKSAQEGDGWPGPDVPAAGRHDATKEKSDV